jgi:Cd2+/Zn2+-exporting ATPase
MVKTVFYISNMDCPEEVSLIKKKLQAMPEIHELTFNLIRQEVTVTYEHLDIARIQDILQNLGMKAHARLESQRDEQLKLSPAVTRKNWIIIGLSGLLASSAEIVSFGTHLEHSTPVIALAVTSMLIGGCQTFLKGLRAIRYFNLNMNFLMSVAIIGAIAIGEWPEAAMVTFLFALAELIEVYSLDRARMAIRGLMEITPDTVRVQDTGGWRIKSVKEIEVGAVIWVKPGERIPLDGIIVKGQTTVNQAPITGESMPIDKNTNDSVFAGTLNERGSFEFKVTVQPGNTLLAKIIRAVQQAQTERAPTQRFVDQFAKYYTPIMVVFALLVAIIPPFLLGAAFLPWFYKALVLLVIACPCALVISTPVTIVSGLAAAAKHGILVKGGTYLEIGHRLKAVAFDKTGTLTHGQPVVTDLLTLTTLPEEFILQLAASLDTHSEHPIAAAIVKFWHKNNPNAALLPVNQFEAIPGLGVAGIINEQRYYLGNHRLAEEKNICSIETEIKLKQLEQLGKTTIILGTEHNALGILAVADTSRESSQPAIKTLHQLGLKSIMITGDNPTTAQAIAKILDIDDVRANLLPQDKLTIIDELLKQYKMVGMIGDGINDAPALAKATIGFAMGKSTDVALETADITLIESNLNKLPFFIKLSKRVQHKLLENISLSIGIKGIFFILAFFGIATLWMAIFADMGASFIVVINGLRLLKYKEE